MSNETVKSALRATMIEARTKLDKIEQAEAEAENAALVGKTFRYRNCYSCPESPSDYWWVWRVVESADGHGLIVRDFSVDKDGRIVMESDKYCVGVSGWSPVSLKLWRAALAKFRKAADKWLDETGDTP